MKYDRLIDNTTNFNYDDCENKMNDKYFLLYSQKTQEIIARFAWWVCHQILYEQHGNKLIDIKEIFNADFLYNQLRLYIYTCNVIENVISVNFPDNKESLQIKFKNTDRL